MKRLNMLSEALPVFESTTFCAALVEPTFSGPNARLAGDMLTTGAGGGGGLLLPPPPLPPPPPPQATHIPATSSTLPSSQLTRRRPVVVKAISVASTKKPANVQSHPRGRRKLPGGRNRGAVVALYWGVVVTVSVAVTGEELVTLTDEGETAQEIPGPLIPQDKLTVPVNP